jgi:hypothetical protein
MELNDVVVIAKAQQYPWNCPNCKMCAVCDEAGDESKLMMCDACDRGYHTYCLKPALDKPPEGTVFDVYLQDNGYARNVPNVHHVVKKACNHRKRIAGKAMKLFRRITCARTVSSVTNRMKQDDIVHCVWGCMKRRAMCQ